MIVYQSLVDSHVNSLTYNMNSVITNFANDYIRISQGFVTSTISVVNAYIRFNNGSTAGKLKLYAYLQSLNGVSKVRSEFYGIELIEPTETPLVEEVVTPVVEEVKEVKEVVVVMSDYERMCLELKEKKMEQARMMQETRLMEQKKMEERKLALKQSEKEKDRNLTKELELMKIQFKSECFNKSMEFQKEVNNQNRYLSAGFVDRKTEYVTLGTASNVHIEYDSALDNLNEMKYDIDVKKPIEQCFIISKLDTNEISNEIKQKIAEEYESVNAIVDEIEVKDSNNTKTYIEISSNEIKRLKDIETEARLYSRVHTKVYNRCLEENTKMNDKIARKSLLPAMDYVVTENNIRSDNANNVLIDCYCCQTTLNIKDAHRSHIVAKELGGSCDKSNIRVCCKACNLDMGIMDLEVYKSSKSKLL